MKYVASFDVGTTNVKGVLISEKGGIFAEMSQALDTFYSENNNIEQDPEQWWQSVVSIAHIWWDRGFDPKDVEALTFTGQMQDLIPIKKDGKPVRNAILYSDGRAGKQAEGIVKRFNEDYIKKMTGNHLNGQMPFAKILWMMEEEKDNFDETSYFLLSSKDYIIRQLTGRSVTDCTTGATSGMMNLEGRSWMGCWAEEYDIDINLLPKLLHPDETAGVITDNASQITGFLQSTPVFAGVGDAGATTIGAGAINAGDVYTYIGTTGWMAMPVNEVSNNGQGMFNLAHVKKNLFIAVAPIMNAGNVHKWAASVFEDCSDSNINNAFSIIDNRILNSKPGSSGVIFLPYLNGERCPVYDSSASGSFIGIKSSVTKGDMCRAVLEGTAMALRQVMDIVLNGESIERMTLIGGGSRSKVWCQIIADVCQVDVFVPYAADYLAALGSVSPAFVKLGWVEDYQEFADKYILSKSGSKYKANKETFTLYDKIYSKYLMLYPALKPIFKAD